MKGIIEFDPRFTNIHELLFDTDNILSKYLIESELYKAKDPDIDIHKGFTFYKLLNNVEYTEKITS